MGNGSSQSIVLGAPRYPQSPAYPSRNNGYPPVPKYVHPQNRVLPKPVAGQRLRSTDNGSILQAAGTIRGAGGHLDAEALRRRSGEKENDCYHHLNLRNHRLFHSDPNIARRPVTGAYGEAAPESYGNRRGYNGGAAGRASKLKYKKKARAPEPPASGNNSLPREFERNQDDIRNRKNLAACKCVAKNRAPQPPSIVVHPPPPPPLPNSVTTRTTIGSQGSHSHELSSAVTRAVECRESRTSYEKNVHPLQKWRNCRSTGDVRIDEQDEAFPSRTTVFDSKKIPDSSSGQARLASYLPQRPDPFQKEIQMVTKNIAEGRQQLTSPVAQPQKDKPQSKSASPPPPKTVSPPKFYFSDPSVFKAEAAKPGVPRPNSSTGNVLGRRPESTTVDEIVPSLQRFSPGRQRFKVPSRNSTPTPQQKAEKEWDHLSKSLYHKQDEDAKIDIRLRPVLPRKNPEPPKFSPSEAWQALGSDGLASSNPSTSDDGRESTPVHAPRRMSDYDRYDAFKHRSMSDSHWTPRQDLLDDSDASSDASEEAVVPRVRPGEISTRFSLPTVMFSNMRPIGTEVKTQQSHDKAKQSKKKRVDHPQFESSPAPNFRRFLSKRSKYLSEEDVVTATSDSNWTFGQYGLQKRGKQYSSELMLSDKKKYELMMKNNLGDFLGDILMSKSNHLRDQMKSSDSGNSNFSFYSTDGQVLYRNGSAKPGECSPPTKGRVHDMRRRFDPNLEPQKPSFGLRNFQKKPKPLDMDLGRRRDLELAKMLEDEVRKRRNKEKISIRQQLQRMKNVHSDEEDEFDDEAYFTEPKSREESQSPFFSPSRPHTSSDMGQSRFGQGPSRTVVDSARLSHWQSSPALLEDSLMKNGIQPTTKGRLSLSSVMSSPDSGAWVQTNAVVDKWLRKQQQEGTPVDAANDGDVSSSPTPAPPKKERRKTNIYKQLMDIVRKEEKHLKNAQRGEVDPNSRDSSYSHRESSPCTSSETASTTSYSDSDSSSARHQGVPANREFGYKQPFHVAFAQPYSPNKAYRPVPFDVVTSTGFRLPGLQEEGKHIQTEVS